MSRAAQVRGQPLVALLAVLGGWIGGRVAAWEPPMLDPPSASGPPHASLIPDREKAYVFDAATGPQSLPGPDLFQQPVELAAMKPDGPVAPVPRHSVQPSKAQFPARAARFTLWNPRDYAWGPTATSFAPSSAPAGEAFPEASLASLSYPEFAPLPSLSDLAAQPSPPSAVGQGVPLSFPSPQARRASRWSADAWMLRRRGGGALASGALPATYGASQAGGVLRYRVAPNSRYRPTAYLRATSTLGVPQESSLALGMSARPVPSLPVIAALEGRMTDYAGTRRFQPAVMAVTELPPFELPLGMRGEAYAQAGYVGAKFATPFADGQFRFDRGLFRYGAIEARLGAGFWGGAQKGAARLDFGPSAAIVMPLGKRVFGRMTLDWRFRAAGNAQPPSGPAVSLSAGF